MVSAVLVEPWLIFLTSRRDGLITARSFGQGITDLRVGIQASGRTKWLGRRQRGLQHTDSGERVGNRYSSIVWTETDDEVGARYCFVESSLY